MGIKKNAINIKFTNYLKQNKNTFGKNMKLYLKQNINSDVRLNKIIKEEKRKKTKQVDQNKEVNNFLKMYVFNKSWNKLANIHKKIKIIEYIDNNLPVKLKKSQKQILIDNLVKLMEEKKLNKKGIVNYDSTIAKITSISILKFTNEKK